MKRYGKEETRQGTLSITKEQFLDLGLPESAIERGELRGKMKTYGSWGIPVSYRALAMSIEQEGVIIYGIRTLSSVSQSGYKLEGRVSIDGKKYRGFTSSKLFDVDGKLVDVATIRVIIK